MPTAGDFITPTICLVREIGAGGMGSVWVADHHALQTQVVVKFMLARVATDADSRLRFTREAAASANVKSPHVAQVLDHGVGADGSPFIVMELLDGCDLETHLKSQPVMPLVDVELVVTQTCKALARAHERGIVHRDIKPQNIFLTNVGGGEVFVKVLDFGIAKAADLQNALGKSTKTGALMGTPFYMSPEQITGAKGVDQRTDLWALGVVAFECLAGRRPFEAETIGGLAVLVCNEPCPPLSSFNASLPPAIDAWMARACARDITQRFSTASEMAEALRAVVSGRTYVTPPPQPSFSAPVQTTRPAPDASSANPLAATTGAPLSHGGATKHPPTATRPRVVRRVAGIVLGGLALLTFGIVKVVALVRESAPPQVVVTTNGQGPSSASAPVLSSVSASLSASVSASDASVAAPPSTGSVAAIPSVSAEASKAPLATTPIKPARPPSTTKPAPRPTSTPDPNSIY